jgi:hypothetical protein
MSPGWVVGRASGVVKGVASLPGSSHITLQAVGLSAGSSTSVIVVTPVQGQHSAAWCLYTSLQHSGMIMHAPAGTYSWTHSCQDIMMLEPSPAGALPPSPLRRVALSGLGFGGAVLLAVLLAPVRWYALRKKCTLDVTRPAAGGTCPPLLPKALAATTLACLLTHAAWVACAL